MKTQQVPQSSPHPHLRIEPRTVVRGDPACGLARRASRLGMESQIRILYTGKFSTKGNLPEMRYETMAK